MHVLRIERRRVALTRGQISTKRKHVWRDVAPVHVESRPEAREENPTRTASGVERWISTFTDQVQHVGDVRGIGTVVLKLSPVPGNESVVPGLRLSIQNSPPRLQRTRSAHSPSAALAPVDRAGRDHSSGEAQIDETPAYAGVSGGTPGGTRTPNLLIRSQTLYPIELRAPASRRSGVRSHTVVPPQGIGKLARWTTRPPPARRPAIGCGRDSHSRHRR